MFYFNIVTYLALDLNLRAEIPDNKVHPGRQKRELKNSVVEY